MQKMVSILLALLLAVTMMSPALAAEPQKLLTINERLAAIEETYGISMPEPQSQLFPGGLLENMDTKAVASSLTALENTFALLGPGFLKKLNKAAEIQNNKNTTRLAPLDYKGEEITGLSIGIVTSADGRWSTHNEDTWILLGGPVSEDQILMTLVFSFMAFNGISEPTGNFVGQQYGSYQTVPTGFLSTWGAQNWQNDYCAVFSHMVRNSTRNQLTPNSILWNKGKTVYDDLVKCVGTGSRATQRTAANLGIEIKPSK